MKHLSRNDLRRAVLQRLDTFTTHVQWMGGGADYAFADSIIEFAEWFADCATETAPSTTTASETPTTTSETEPSDPLATLISDVLGTEEP